MRIHRDQRTECGYHGSDELGQLLLIDLSVVGDVVPASSTIDENRRRGQASDKNLHVKCH